MAMVLEYMALINARVDYQLADGAVQRERDAQRSSLRDTPAPSHVEVHPSPRRFPSATLAHGGPPHILGG
jgi:hypothetical protein